MTGESRTLAEALPEEMARVRQVLGMYYEIGPAGIPAIKLVIEPALAAADRAVMEGNVVAMLRAYEELKKITE